MWHRPSACARFSPTAATGRFDSQQITRKRIESQFRGQLLRTPSAHQRIPSRLSQFTPSESPWTALATIGEQRDLSRSQELEFAHDAIAAPMQTRSTRSSTNTISRDAQRKLVLERLDGSVPAVSHV